MKEIRDLILHLSSEKNKTVFLSSHILHEVEMIANRMIIINKGATQVEGTVDELLNPDKLRVTFEVNDITKAFEIVKLTQWNANFVMKERNRLVFELPKNESAELNKYFIENGLEVSAVIPTRSLENYFLKITETNQ